jgi:hypothetical protein
MSDDVLLMYKFRYFDKDREKWVAPAWRMSREDIVEAYGDTEYEIIEASVEGRRDLGQLTSSGCGAKPKE